MKRFIISAESDMVRIHLLPRSHTDRACKNFFVKILHYCLNLGSNQSRNANFRWWKLCSGLVKKALFWISYQRQIREEFDCDSSQRKHEFFRSAKNNRDNFEQQEMFIGTQEKWEELNIFQVYKCRLNVQGKELVCRKCIYFLTDSNTR